MRGRNPEAAEAELRRDYETLDRLGERYLLPTIAAMLAHVVYAQGRYDEAFELSVRAEELGSEDDVDAQARWRRARAKVLAQRGDLEAAEALAQASVRLMQQTDALVDLADAKADLADVLELAGRADEALVVRREAHALYERKGTLGSVVQGRLA